MNESDSLDLLPSLITFSGPSGSGKSSTARKLVDQCPRIAIGQGVTTRPPRPRELAYPIRHREYCYSSDEEFDERSTRGEFAWEVTIDDTRYATPKWLFNRKDSKTTLLIVEPNTVGKARALCRGFAMSFYFFPPSERELIRRIKNRGDSNEDIAKRLEHNRDREFWTTPLRDQTIDWISLRTERQSTTQRVALIRTYLRI